MPHPGFGVFQQAATGPSSGMGQHGRVACGPSRRGPAYHVSRHTPENTSTAGPVMWT